MGGCLHIFCVRVPLGSRLASLLRRRFLLALLILLWPLRERGLARGLAHFERSC
jgi:hypothetical protein